MAMLFAGLIEWSQVSPSPRLTWPLVVGQPYYRDCYDPGRGPGHAHAGLHRRVLLPVTVWIDPDDRGGRSRTFAPWSTPEPPIPVANPPLDSMVVGIENRLGVGQLLVEITHTPDDTGVLGLAASISAVPVRVEWAIEGEVFLTCGPAESMIGVDGMPGCAPHVLDQHRWSGRRVGHRLLGGRGDDHPGRRHGAERAATPGGRADRRGDRRARGRSAGPVSAEAGRGRWLRALGEVGPLGAGALDLPEPGHRRHADETVPQAQRLLGGGHAGDDRAEQARASGRRRPGTR